MEIHDCYCGIDNGVSGSIGIISKEACLYFPTPTITVFNYTKAEQRIRRIDFEKMLEIFDYLSGKNVKVVFERPMVNPARWKATQSALRSMEATLIALEVKKLSFDWVDSKQWQRELLPSGLEGIELKVASLQVGKRLFPKIDWEGNKFEDADGILLAEWARRNNL